MPNAADIKWFKETFQAQIEPALAGTPFTVDFITALACQETGLVWQVLRKANLGKADLVRLCVGDSREGGRKAFPTNKAELVAARNGTQMFDIARKALVDMAAYVPAYRAEAARPHKFCHGFGMFQRDLQHFSTDPDYFLLKKYERFEDTLSHCVRMLKEVLRTFGWKSRTTLSDSELVAVGIAYNTGGYKRKRGLLQGYFDGQRYYGEYLYDYLRLSRTVSTQGRPASLPAPLSGQAIIPPPARPSATGDFYKIDTRLSTLRIRSEPVVSSPEVKNVTGELPDGMLVRAVSPTVRNGFIEVESSLSGALLRGYVAKEFLVGSPGSTEIPVVVPSPVAATTGVVAVQLRRPSGLVTRRRDPAGAHSLNEPGQPKRAGTDAETLRREIAAIVDWLAVDNGTHLRYLPREGKTYCNIYCHDFCHLAGVVLPRTWWTSAALKDLRDGKSVEPRIGNTVFEVRANDLFRWLRDFGPDFGWRQTPTPTTLQEAANQGAICVVVARRREDGRSGHIVMVLPESNNHASRRDERGEVIAPLQSQAGSSNFQYGTGRQNWWKETQFAEFAFWIHP